MVALVLYDLDGTLVDSVGEMALAINDALAELAPAAVTRDQVAGWIGHGTRDLLGRVAAWVEQTQEQVLAPDRLAALYDTHYERRCGTVSTLYPAVRETLAALRQAGIKQALVTNKETRFVRPLLQGHGLLEAFDALVCGDSYPRRKPDPMGVLACLERFQVAPDQALMVGDSSVDVLTARQAGIGVWAVPYGYNQGQPVADSAPDRVIDTLQPLQAWVQASGDRA